MSAMAAGLGRRFGGSGGGVAVLSLRSGGDVGLISAAQLQQAQALQATPGSRSGPLGGPPPRSSTAWSKLLSPDVQGQV